MDIAIGGGRIGYYQLPSHKNLTLVSAYGRCHTSTNISYVFSCWSQSNRYVRYGVNVGLTDTADLWITIEYNQ